MQQCGNACLFTSTVGLVLLFVEKCCSKFRARKKSSFCLAAKYQRSCVEPAVAVIEYRAAKSKSRPWMLYGCRSPWLQGSLKRNDQADQMKPSLSVQQFSAALSRGCGSPRAGLREGWLCLVWRALCTCRKASGTRAEIKIMSLSSMWWETLPNFS